MCDTFTVGNAIYVIKQILHINRNTQSFLFQSRFHTGVKLWDSGILISHKSFFKWNRVFIPRKFLYSLHQINCDATNTHFLRRVTYNLHSLKVSYWMLMHYSSCEIVFCELMIVYFIHICCDHPSLLQLRRHYFQPLFLLSLK